jgi:hypothetical protein
VIEHVRGFRREGLAVPLNGGDGRLDRLLAELLGGLGRPLGEELGRVGGVAGLTDRFD